MAQRIDFILNDREVHEALNPGQPVLDYLRGVAALPGTKEGCREGDCGACTVLIGELNGKQVRYRPVTSCLMPVGELHGKHLVTIEGLNLDWLTPVQQAIVDRGASQCGFCTPGIVVSMTGLLMQDGQEIDRPGVMRALSGHLCRCTGYLSLKQGDEALREALGGPAGIRAMLKRKLLPDYFAGIPERLGKLPPPAIPTEAQTQVYFIAGGTDLYVQEEHRLTEGQVEILAQRSDLKGITRENGRIAVGALTTFEDFASHPEIISLLPNVQSYMALIASWQIRNRATLGGNIINASPIADLTIMLLALEAELVLQDGESRRTVPLRSFYRGYKEMDRAPKELLAQIMIPTSDGGSQFHFEKVSKRKYLDIASVNCALRIDLAAGEVRQVGLAMGGVAPIPLFMEQTTQYLLGRPISTDTVQGAIDVAQDEVSPISDIRGSAEYKRLLVRQLLIAQFTTLFPDELSVGSFYDAY